MATPHGIVVENPDLIPGITMPRLVVVERDYPALAAQLGALGPLTAKLGMTIKGVKYDPDKEIEYLGTRNGLVEAGPAAGRPKLATDIQACEMVLAFSGSTNGRLGSQGFRQLEKHTGQKLAHLASDNEGRGFTFKDVQDAPVPVLTSPEWSGSEHGGRRYSAFTINVEHLKPWHTLTGRQHFYLDHDWMIELGEQLPIYRPPLDMHRLFDDSVVGSTAATGAQGSKNRAEVAVRYLTPHSKWSIHSEYQDNLLMLSLSRGGPPSGCRRRTPTRSVCATTSGSSRTTATAWSWPGPSCRTGCRRARCTCTTRRTAPSMCPSPRPVDCAVAATTRSPASCSSLPT